MTFSVVPDIEDERISRGGGLDDPRGLPRSGGGEPARGARDRGTTSQHAVRVPRDRRGSAVREADSVSGHAVYAVHAVRAEEICSTEVLFTAQERAEEYAADLSTDPGVLAGVVTEFVVKAAKGWIRNRSLWERKNGTTWKVDTD